MHKVSVKIRCYTRDICFEVFKKHKGLSAWKSLADFMALGLMK